MPLRDHFHPPLSRQHHWESFHDAWINTMVRHLNLRWLPAQYRADPQTHLEAFVQADVVAWDRNPGAVAQSTNGTGVAVASWAPPQATQTFTVDLTDPDIFEVRVFDTQHNTQLVAAVELVSPSNKDRPSSRDEFVCKCAGYLQKGVAVTVVDVITERRDNLHNLLLQLLEQPPLGTPVETAELYAVAYRSAPQKKGWQLDIWPEVLTLQTPLPTLPLWLTPTLAVPLELEATYEETLRVLRL